MVLSPIVSNVRCNNARLVTIAVRMAGGKDGVTGRVKIPALRNSMNALCTSASIGLGMVACLSVRSKNGETGC